jgi:hypothetical protein
MGHLFILIAFVLTLFLILHQIPSVYILGVSLIQWTLIIIAVNLAIALLAPVILVHK